jgi:hypothetical protein
MLLALQRWSKLSPQARAIYNIIAVAAAEGKGEEEDHVLFYSEASDTATPVGATIAPSAGTVVGPSSTAAVVGAAIAPASTAAGPCRTAAPAGAATAPAGTATGPSDDAVPVGAATALVRQAS